MYREETEETIKRGEIYWINPNPYRENIGSVQRADRPAIIVSNDSINTGMRALEVVFLTTAPKQDRNTHVTIRSCTKPSIALCEQIQTVSDEQIGKYIGKLTRDEMEAVERGMLISLALNIPTKPEEKTDSEAAINKELEEKVKQQEKEHLEALEARTEAKIYKRMYEELLQKVLKTEGLTPQE